MWCNQPAMVLVSMLASFGAFATDAAAIELSRTGETIHVLGTIKIGDAKEFRAYLERFRSSNADPLQQRAIAHLVLVASRPYGGSSAVVFEVAGHGQDRTGKF